ELVAADLVERAGDRVRARVAILPVGIPRSAPHSSGLVICDRHDAPATSELVCWPDDSSQHLANAIPHHRVARWLDLGCGSAYAPLARPGVAGEITGVELNPRAVAYSRLGATLSGIAHLEIVHGDLAVAQPAAALVTCNAPMPTLATDPDDAVMWRHTDDDLFARLVAVIPARVAPGGVAVVHAALSAIALEALPGERRVVAYTPSGAVPGFGVLWWRPDAPARLAITHRALTPERPHLDARDGESC
nr:methyltransferase [Deltaproteobacteria bacterium]